MEKLEGLIAAPFTPMHPDGTLDPTKIERQANELVRRGVRGAFICGTTGEGLSLSSDERMQVTETWCRARPEGLMIIAHVGHASLPEAQHFAAHAADLGVDAMAAMPSSLYASHRIEELVEHAAAIAMAAPELPFFHYHIPAISHIRVPVYDFLVHAADRIPNLAGVKFTFEDLMDYSRCLHLQGGRFDMLFGRDEILLAGLAVGARSAVGSTYNFAAPVYHKLIDAFQRGDVAEARRHQQRVQELVAVILEFPGMAAQKRAMHHIGLDLGPVRSPQRRLTAEETYRLDQRLESIGFAEICAVVDTVEG